MTSHTLWSRRTDHCALLIFLKLKQLSLCLSMFPLSLILSFPSFLFYFSSFLLHPPRAINCPTFSLTPPAGVWLVKSGGCWGSSQSCKWGPPPGWPRHSVVQVRKPATLPTEQRWEREGLCVEWCLLPHWREKEVCGYSDSNHNWWTPSSLHLFYFNILASHFITLIYMLLVHLALFDVWLNTI